MKKKILVICAHPDDEIFTFSQIENFSKNHYEVSALFFTESKIRRKEAELSCNLNRWNILFSSDYGLNLYDGKFHLKFRELDIFFQNILEEYQVILSPAIEGGHQDHDTIGLSIYMKALEQKDKQFYFYTTYTALSHFGFYKVMSKSNYAESLFVEDKKFSKKINLRPLSFFFKVYKSQFKSGFLLAIPWIIQAILNKYICTYKVKKNSPLKFYKLINEIKGTPLFEIHRRCKKNNWIKIISSQLD
mgnify:CR=1 FL=1